MLLNLPLLPSWRNSMVRGFPSPWWRKWSTLHCIWKKEVHMKYINSLNFIFSPLDLIQISFCTYWNKNKVSLTCPEVRWWPSWFLLDCQWLIREAPGLKCTDKCVKTLRGPATTFLSSAAICLSFLYLDIVMKQFIYGPTVGCIMPFDQKIIQLTNSQ